MPLPYSMPKTLVIIMTIHGTQIVIKSPKGIPEIRAEISEARETGEIILLGYEHTDFKPSQQSSEILYSAGNEHYHIPWHQVSFYVLREVSPPPRIKVAEGPLPPLPRH